MFQSSWTKYLVSQFTLLAKTKKGTKPDFHGAANPEEASRLYHYFVQKVKDMYQMDRVKDGKFQAMMEVALVNDGPVSCCWIRASLSSLMLMSFDLDRLPWSSKPAHRCLNGSVKLDDGDMMHTMNGIEFNIGHRLYGLPCLKWIRDGNIERLGLLLDA